MKILRTALLAALAVLAVSASVGVASASAKPGIKAGSYPVELYVKADKTKENILEAYGTKRVCHPPGFYAGNMHGPFSAFSTVSWTEPPACETTMWMNDCKFSFDVQTLSTGTFAITPGGCGPIKFENAWHSCDFLVKPGSNFKGQVTYEDLGTTLRANVVASGLNMTSPDCSEIPETNSAIWRFSYIIEDRFQSAPLDLAEI